MADANSVLLKAVQSFYVDSRAGRIETGLCDVPWLFMYTWMVWYER